MVERILLTTAGGSVPEYLYRIFPLNRLCQTLSTASNTLVSPSLWEDTFEAAHLKTQIRYPLYGRRRADGLIDSSTSPLTYGSEVIGYWTISTNAADNVYCQCWSATAESDAMWRIYSPAPEYSGVKVRVRTVDLLRQLISNLPDEAAFLGEVSYLSEDQLEEEIRDAAKNHLIQMRPDTYPGLFGEGIARVLLKKRTQFSHEAEFRLMIVRAGVNRLPDPPKVLSYSFDPRELFIEAELDPRLQDESEVRRRLLAAGFTGEIQRSKLYRSPTLVHHWQRR